MKSRVKLIREAFNYSFDDFSKLLNVNPGWLFMAENTLDPLDIPESIIHTICAMYQVPKEFVLGYSYKVRIPFKDWHKGMREDYIKGNSQLKEVITAMCGNLEFIED